MPLRGRPGGRAPHPSYSDEYTTKYYAHRRGREATAGATRHLLTSPTYGQIVCGTCYSNIVLRNVHSECRSVGLDAMALCTANVGSPIDLSGTYKVGADCILPPHRAELDL